MEKAKNFSIPKLKPVKSKDNLRNVEINSRDAIELISIINRNCINERYKEDWTIDKVSLVNNSQLQNEYSCKRKEFKEGGRNQRELAEHYGFLFVKDMVLISKMIKEGLKTKKSVFNPLGDNEFGIYICKYPDVQLKIPLMKQEDSAYIIIFKYMLGKCKAIPPQSNITGEPAPNYDSTTSSLATLINDPPNILFPRSQIYLYEYDDDVLPINRPRQCLPVAVVSFIKADKTQTKTSFVSSSSNITSSSSSSTFVNRRRSSDQGSAFRPGTYGARNQALKRTSLDQPQMPLLNVGYNMEGSLQPPNNPSMMNLKEGLKDTSFHDSTQRWEKPGTFKPELMTDTGVKPNLPTTNLDLISRQSSISDPRRSAPDPRRSAYGQSIYSSGSATNSISSQSDLPQKIGEKPLHPFMRKKKKGTLTVSTSQTQMRKNNLIIEKLDYSVSDTSNVQLATEEEDSATNLPATPSNVEDVQPSPARTNMEEMIKTVNKLFGKSPKSNEQPNETVKNVQEMFGPHSGYDNTENLSEKLHLHPSPSPTKIEASSAEASPIKQEAKNPKESNYVQSLAAQLQNLGDLQDVISKFNFNGDVSPQKISPHKISPQKISPSVNSEHKNISNPFFSKPDTTDYNQTNFSPRQSDLLTSVVDKPSLEHYQQSNISDVDNSNITVNCYGDVDYRQKQAPSKNNLPSVQYTRSQNDPRQTLCSKSVQHSPKMSDQVNISSNGTRLEKTITSNEYSKISTKSKHAVSSNDQAVFSSDYSVANSKLTSNKYPFVSHERLVTSSEHPVVRNERPVTSSERHLVSNEYLATSSEHPVTSREQSVASIESPVAVDESNFKCSTKQDSCDILCEEWLKDEDTNKMISTLQPKIEVVDLKKIAEASLTNCKTCIMERDDLAAYISNRKHNSVKSYLEHTCIELFSDYVKGNEEKMDSDSVESSSDVVIPAKRRNSCDDKDVTCTDAKRLKSIFESSVSDSKFSWLSDKPILENEFSNVSSLTDSCAKDVHHHDDDDDDEYANELIIDLKPDLNARKLISSGIEMSDFSTEKQNVLESSGKITSDKSNTTLLKQEVKPNIKELEQYNTNYFSETKPPNYSSETKPTNYSAETKPNVKEQYSTNYSAETKPNVKELEYSTNYSADTKPNVKELEYSTNYSAETKPNVKELEYSTTYSAATKPNVKEQYSTNYSSETKPNVKEQYSTNYSSETKLNVKELEYSTNYSAETKPNVKELEYSTNYSAETKPTNYSSETKPNVKEQYSTNYSSETKPYVKELEQQYSTNYSSEIKPNMKELEQYSTNYSSETKPNESNRGRSHSDVKDKVKIDHISGISSNKNNLEPAGRGSPCQSSQHIQQQGRTPVDLNPKIDDKPNISYEKLHLDSSEFTSTQNSEENFISSGDSMMNNISNEDIMESQNFCKNLDEKETKLSKMEANGSYMSEAYKERLKLIKLKYSCPTFPLPPTNNKYASVKQELEIIRNCLENLSQIVLCDPKSDSPDEDTLRSALLHVETELIMELQDSHFLYRPNQRLPSSLLFDYEMNCLYATGDCFMYLNTFLTKQLYKSLLNIKHDILDAYKEKQNLSGTSSRLSYLTDHLNYLLNKRKILIRTLTGSVKSNRLVQLEKARKHYIWSIEHMKQSVMNYDNSQMKNMNRLLSELTEHTCRIRSELES